MPATALAAPHAIVSFGVSSHAHPATGSRTLSKRSPGRRGVLASVNVREPCCRGAVNAPVCELGNYIRECAREFRRGPTLGTKSEFQRPFAAPFFPLSEPPPKQNKKFLPKGLPCAVRG